MENFNSKDLIIPNEENIWLVKNPNECDKYDYMISVACGTVGGLVDVFLVGSPEDSVLGKWTDELADKAVMKFAKAMGWSSRAGKENSVASAIGFLEKKFRVNYDQRYTTDVGGKFKMGTTNHHMKSLAHSPDIIGLFFSILNQFTSTSTFISNGKIITIDTETQELMGGNFIAKLFCGFINWLGHLMSDVAGSSGSRGNSGRGSGIVMPFYELLGLCNFGKFNVGKDKQTLAEIATRAFQDGYDFRFGMALSIPVLLTELLIRVIWAFRQHFQFKRPIKECIFPGNRSGLRMMLLVGNGTLCVVDGADALIKSDMNMLVLFTRLNLVAWNRLVMLVLQEIFIRLGISADFDEYVDSYRIVNLALQDYLTQLKTLDIAQYKIETEKYNSLVISLKDVTSQNDMNCLLLKTLDDLNIDKPWEGDFDSFMSDKNNRLVFN
ncbi:MAG: hypothetical protein U0M02_12910 [Acutalibacteraceae bacterium]|nr:hypothetical protein [Acutalibacteraceae bacterium]